MTIQDDLKTIVAVMVFATVASGQTLADRQTVVNALNQDNPRAGEYHFAAEGPAKATLLIVVVQPVTPEECKETYGVDLDPDRLPYMQYNNLTSLGFATFGVKCTTERGKSYVYSVALRPPGQTPHFTPEPPPPGASQRTDTNTSTQTARGRLIESQQHMDQGYALQMQGDQIGAIPEYNLAIRLYPNFVKAHGQLANALSSLGDHDGAIKELRTAIGLDPFYKVAHYNLALELSRKGVKEADEHYRAACPNFSSRFCPAPPARTKREQDQLDCESSGGVWINYGALPENRLKGSSFGGFYCER
jgi:tetratricopeptide (TPR) repeat protein